MNAIGVRYIGSSDLVTRKISVSLPPYKLGWRRATGQAYICHALPTKLQEQKKEVQTPAFVTFEDHAVSDKVSQSSQNNTNILSLLASHSKQSKRLLALHDGGASIAAETPGRFEHESVPQLESQANDAVVVSQMRQAAEVIPDRMDFETMHAQLKAWRERYHSSHVPHYCFDAPLLGAWVRWLRKMHKHERLPQWKIDRLNQLDFEWKVNDQDAKWHSSFHQLRRYKSIHGTTDMEPGYKHPADREWTALGTWLRRQAILLVKEKLSERKQLMLATLGVTLRVPEELVQRYSRLRGLNAHERKLERRRWREEREAAKLQAQKEKEKQEAAEAARVAKAEEEAKRRALLQRMQQLSGSGASPMVRSVHGVPIALQPAVLRQTAPALTGGHQRPRLQLPIAPPQPATSSPRPSHTATTAAPASASSTAAPSPRAAPSPPAVTLHDTRERPGREVVFELQDAADVRRRRRVPRTMRSEVPAEGPWRAPAGQLSHALTSPRAHAPAHQLTQTSTVPDAPPPAQQLGHASTAPHTPPHSPTEPGFLRSARAGGGGSGQTSAQTNAVGPPLPSRPSAQSVAAPSSEARLFRSSRDGSSASRDGSSSSRDGSSARDDNNNGPATTPWHTSPVETRLVRSSRDGSSPSRDGSRPRSSPTPALGSPFSDPPNAGPKPAPPITSQPDDSHAPATLGPAPPREPGFVRGPRSRQAAGSSAQSSRESATYGLPDSDSSSTGWKQPAWTGPSQEQPQPGGQDSEAAQQAQGVSRVQQAPAKPSQSNASRAALGPAPCREPGFLRRPRSGQAAGVSPREEQRGGPTTGSWSASTVSSQQLPRGGSSAGRRGAGHTAASR